MIRILHGSHWFKHDPQSFLLGLARLGMHPIHGVAATGFMGDTPAKDADRSRLVLEHLTRGLDLNPSHTLCLPQPQDLARGADFFNQVFHRPLLGRDYHPQKDLEMIQCKGLQLLATPDLVDPLRPGMTQELFNLKVDEANKAYGGGHRLFLTGLPPERWRPRPCLYEGIKILHEPLVLHGGVGRLSGRKHYFSVGADQAHFNVVELERGRLVIHHFQKDEVWFRRTGIARMGDLWTENRKKQPGKKQPGKKQPGRPLKYGYVLASLKDEEIYSPGLIARHAIKNGMIDPNPMNKLRLRHTLARFSVNHGFPAFGDGMVMLPGQAPKPGYLGSRWKTAAGIVKTSWQIEKFKRVG